MIVTALLLFMALGLVGMMVFHLLCLLVRVSWAIVRTLIRDAWRKLKISRPIALPMRAFNSSEVLYSWEDWDRDAREAHPIPYFLGESVPRFLRRQLGWPLHAWGWFRCHAISRYHFLDLRNPEYQWGYVDAQEAMLYACFNILKQFVENERGIECEIADSASDEQREIEYEIQALYVWWIDLRWDDQARIRQRWRKAKTREERTRVHQLEELAVERDKVNLARLMNVRPCLWT